MSEKLFGVIGSPIWHSLSPYIFNSLFHAIHLDGLYTRISSANPEDALHAAKSLKLNGANVTSPLKESILSHLDELDSHAEKIGAVNTVVFREGGTTGFNTDYWGVARAIESGGVSLDGKRGIVIGAGGAAKAAVYALKNSSVSSVAVVIRSPKTKSCSPVFSHCELVDFREMAGFITENDVVISCIPGSLTKLRELQAQKKFVLFEADYRSAVRSGVNGIVQRGRKSIFGLDWLFYQAISAFDIFTGKKIAGNLQKMIRSGLNKQTTLRKKNIALIGFMGAGKSLVGSLLADHLGWEFVDTDLLLEKESGLPIRDMFEVFGEEKFRRLESSAVQHIMLPDNPRIVALGGGCVLDERNRWTIRQHCSVVWLLAGIRESIGRIDPRTRPLLMQGDPLKKAEELFASRIPLYARLGDLVVCTDGHDPCDITRRIKSEIDIAG